MSILGAPESFSEDCDSTRGKDIAGGPVFHLILVSNGVGQHVVTMSVLTSGVVSCSLQPARGVRESCVGAWKVNFTFGGDIVGIKLFKMDLDMAVIYKFEFTDLAIGRESL